MCTCRTLQQTGRYVAQEGGDHYQSVYQHWDWVTDIEMGYLPGNATKYVSRWRKKNGLADLKKAMTYVDKMIAIIKANPDYRFNREASYKTRVCTDNFVVSNGLNDTERSFCEILTGPCHIRMLELAKQLLDQLIRTAQRAQEGQGAAGGMVAPTTPSSPSLDQKTSLPGRAGCTTTQPPASSASTELSKSGHTERLAPWISGGDE
jgi:hypothetical protein